MKTILVDAVYTLVSDKGELDHKLFELLETLENPKVVLTNAAHEKFEGYGLDRLPHEVFTLQHNPEKTDPDYFKTLLRHLNLSPQDVIYFEHSAEAVKSAQSIKIVSYHYDEAKKDLSALKNFLNNNL